MRIEQALVLIGIRCRTEVGEALEEALNVVRHKHILPRWPNVAKKSATRSIFGHERVKRGKSSAE
jgi:hypothetical protein